ncbi:MAG: hypothetical protein DRP46_06630 [Candidatus Zixiibacteriota bacterium]|nr:MAG: hypothetical protein DRP46_06630 [candidate division Zixibacteria bacterium]
MASIAKYMTVLAGRDKSLCGCVLRRKVGRFRKSLIDIGMQRSCIPMKDMELHESASKSEKTKPFLTHYHFPADITFWEIK